MTAVVASGAVASDALASGAVHLAAAGARAVCVLVHGRGQSPEEMQSHILARLAVPDVAFILPRAPNSGAAGGAWYNAKAVDPLTDETIAALAAARNHLAADVASARALYPGLPLVLAGFSQGACLSLEYAFAGLPAPQALVALTGCRVGALEDVRPRELPPELPIWLTGSDNDPWIPVTAFAEAALELGRGRARLQAALYPGRGHEVSDAEIALLQGVLQAPLG